MFILFASFFLRTTEDLRLPSSARRPANAYLGTAPAGAIRGGLRGDGRAVLPKGRFWCGSTAAFQPPGSWSVSSERCFEGNSKCLGKPPWHITIFKGYFFFGSPGFEKSPSGRWFLYDVFLWMVSLGMIPSIFKFFFQHPPAKFNGFRTRFWWMNIQDIYIYIYIISIL